MAYVVPALVRPQGGPVGTVSAIQPGQELDPGSLLESLPDQGIEPLAENFDSIPTFIYTARKKDFPFLGLQWPTSAASKGWKAGV